jgi:phosphoribosyl-AMP cyclohydrolase
VMNLDCDYDLQSITTDQIIKEVCETMSANCMEYASDSIGK